MTMVSRRCRLSSRNLLLDECGVSMLPTLARLCHDLTKGYITGKAATTKIDRFLTRSSVLRGRHSFGRQQNRCSTSKPRGICTYLGICAVTSTNVVNQQSTTTATDIVPIKIPVVAFKKLLKLGKLKGVSCQHCDIIRCKPQAKHILVNGQQHDHAA